MEMSQWWRKKIKPIDSELKESYTNDNILIWSVNMNIDP